MTGLPSRRADYTWQHNQTHGRHGWLRLTPAYSLRLVDELLAESDGKQTVLDPFCGTGTTALCALQHGHDAISTDINPFLVWLARVKTTTYPLPLLHQVQQCAATAVSMIQHRAISPVPAPPIHNIDRWWSSDAVEFLRLLHSAIAASTETVPAARDLLYVAFCRVLINLSNAAFDHQSMSFKAQDQMKLPLTADYTEDFLIAVTDIVASAGGTFPGAAHIIPGDARNLPLHISQPVNRVITSPPYVNRMSYIRELRPYMYWLGFLRHAREAGELDWQAIGGTWGIATSRLATWEHDAGSPQPPVLRDALDKISAANGKSGHLLVRYVERYFVDVWTHLSALHPLLADNAQVDYIVGNSTYFGVLLPVEQIYAALFAELGFHSLQIHPVRKRNSNKALMEFRIHARWR